MAYGSIKANTITTETGVVNVADFVTNDATPSSRGIMTAADKAKLDGIEASATGDQTGAEIKSLYEAEADTNAFTDADHTKLDGIEVGAQVNVGTDITYASSTGTISSSTGTSAIIPEASSAKKGLMTSALFDKLDGIATGATNVTNNNQLTNGAGYITSFDITTQTDSKYLRSDVSDSVAESAALSFGSQTRQMINLWSTQYGLGVQSSTLYCRSGSRFSWHRAGSHSDSENNAGSGGTVAMTLDGSSNLTAAGNVTAYSDIKLKKDIEVIPNALDKVSQIRGVTYQRKDLDVPRQSGVIAQEVEKVLPEVVMEDPTGTKSVAYGNLVGLLIEAIKELKDEIETLKQERN